MDVLFDYENMGDIYWKISMLLGDFYCPKTVLIYIKYTYYRAERQIEKYNARKLNKLPGVIFCGNLWNFLLKPRNRGPPVIRKRFWWKALEKLEKKFLKKFPTFSIFYQFPSCSRCEREDQASFTTALGRGEVIPFETKPSGKRNRAKKILCLLH